MKIEIDGVEYLPAVPIEELGRQGKVWGTGSPKPYVLVENLEKYTPTRACDCEAQDLGAELADKTEALRAANIHCDALKSKVRELEKENKQLRRSLDNYEQDCDKLRAQLAGKWVLGEKLEPGDRVTMGEPLLFVDNNVLYPCRANGNEEMKESTLAHTDWYRDPRPLPMLADPEVPAVPPLMERIAIARCSSCQCNVKSPEWSKHDPQCRYRVLCEAEELLAALNESEATE